MTHGIPVLAAIATAVAAAGFTAPQQQQTQQQGRSTQQQQQQTQRRTQQSDTLLRATLTGEETGGRGSPRGTGEAVVTLRTTSREVCYNLVIRGIRATQAHIHRAPKGQDGPVAVPFTPPKDSVSAGCARVDSAVVSDIQINPTNYYVNVHTAEFPQGAIRGQLARPIGER